MSFAKQLGSSEVQLDHSADSSDVTSISFVMDSQRQIYSLPSLCVLFPAYLSYQTKTLRIKECDKKIFFSRL